MNSKILTVEHFLTPTAALRYSIGRFRIFGSFRDLFVPARGLAAHYSEEMIFAERFRADLARSLSSDDKTTKAAAERWSHFLKSRVSVMEPWSGLSTALVAMFGLIAAAVPIVAPEVPIASRLVLVVAALPLLWFKSHVDDRVAWFKFVVGHLEAISQVGANRSFEPTPLGKPRTAASLQL